MNKIFRTIDNNYKTLKWDPTMADKYDLKRCHWGQLKLFYSELEFFTICSKFYDLSTCVAVYVGAAPGHHISMFRKLFPDLHFILYDPANFAISSDKFIEINTGSKGFFTDNTINEVLKKTIGKKVLFISDIRLVSHENNKESFENDVFSDMIKQQKWAIMLNSEMLMLKFRLPYGDANLSYDTSQLNKYNVEINIDKSIKNGMLYLDGELFIQISPNTHSTETRLISRKTNNKFYLKTYDVDKYESQCFYYNCYDRIKDYKYKDSQLLKEHLLGFDDTYDRVCEYYIYCKYQKYYLKSEYDFSQIVRFLYDAHKYLYNTTNRTIMLCNIDTIIRDVIKRLPNRQHSKKVPHDKAIKYQHRLIKNTNKQIQYFHKGDILEQKQYISQIELLQKNLKVLDNKVNQITNIK
jgi:hypothetical protein